MNGDSSTLVETPRIKDILATLEEQLKTGYEILRHELPPPPGEVEDWMDSDILNEWLATTLMDFHTTARHMQVTRVIVEEAKHLWAGMQREAGKDRRISGTMANHKPQYEELMDRLKELKHMFRDRMDAQRVEVDGIRTALFSLRAPL